jgi:hypothetical protein
MALPNITATGMKGYLQWLRADQPGLFQIIAPQLPQLVPQAFSDYEQSQAMGYLMGFADDSDDSDDDALDVETDAGDDLPTTIADPTLQTVSVSASDLAPSVSIISAANSGSADPAVTAGVQSTVSTALNALVANGTITAAQAQTYANMTATQLANAQSGASPTQLSSAASGLGQLVSSVGSGLASTTGLLVIAGVLLLGGLLLGGAKNATVPGK